MLSILNSKRIVQNDSVVNVGYQSQLFFSFKSGRIRLSATLLVAKVRIAGEVFSGHNKPKRDVQGGKKFAVAAKEGDTVRLVRFGDANMTIKKDDPERRASFRARHKCDEKKSKLTAGYWSCKAW